MFRPGPSRLLGLLAATAVAGTSLLAVASPAQAASLNLTQYVNPFIGTDDSSAPNPVPGGAGGSTVPGPVQPFGMVQLSPDTPTASPSGYRYSDAQIEEFSLTHFNGAGCANNEDLGILPMTGAIGTSPGTAWTSYRATQNKSQEQASPGFYQAVLSNYGNTRVEAAATTRTAALRLTYPSTNTARVLINTSRSATGSRSGSITISGSTVTGSVTGGGFCGNSKTYQIFYRMEFDRAPTGVGTWLGGTVSAGSTTTSGTNSGGYLTFDTSTNPVVQVRVGISFVSQAGAQANLAAEQSNFDFDAVRSRADAEWNAILNRVQVTGGSAADLQKFYTALYRVFINPNVSNDVNGQYRGFDNAIHTAGHTVYQNYSGWDIYRSWAALIAFIAPAEATDIAKSMVLDGQQGGLLPKWSHNTNEAFVMTGDPGPIIVDSLYQFGARGFDTAAALALMKKSSNGGTMQGSPIRGRQSGYVQRQYIDGDPSDSLEYSASDFAVAQFARALGDTATYDTHMARAQWWRNVFNTESGYIHPRNADGTWPWPLDPASQSNYVEGNASQYTWMVPYNFAGLINLLGGRQTALQRLDHHFTQTNGGQSQPYFYIGNEPEHGVPWAYHFAAAPAGTSAAVRRVMNESFTTGAGGLPGNDDLGATSAWFVWSALGMYPPTPGADTLALHGPLFPSILVDRPAGDLQINAASAGQGNQYVQNLSVNGTSTQRAWLRYGDLAGGATLSYTMGGSPSSWGTNPADVPPSFTDGFTPPPAAPDLGPNLAAGKPATGSTPCAATEGPEKAFDGRLGSTSKWCSLAAGTKTLQVDLGTNQTVRSFVVKHAGLGAENTGWNTGGFTIQTSTDGSTWTTRATVSGNRSSRTYHPISAATARYVRLNVSTPTNNGNTAARIDEFEVYGGSGPTNLALNRPATADSQCASTEGPEKAVNGSTTGGTSDKWCSGGATKFLRIDLGGTHPIQTVTVYHAGAGGEDRAWNTRDFDVQVSADGSIWTTAAQVRGNTADVTNTPVTATGRYLRLNILTPTQTTDAAARLYEVEVYGT
ncbi:GH92 family glycosyl hydrolase [Micromonospora sp. 4G57]|uniref:GH92 family glycosyl hydrolase n=1 Tax=Micromonospora sicca TaxID=2202420 RepID=A0ABU5J8R9_9ACTN|nr:MULTISPECIES: GH92 family glycosyl hydrolase [unclassified Micromonospora]MDZ5443565.1 GH92 family glycosyl hydrolase [Micromonospora sp. 4G57]MDZ5488962.1 GH92 family glycosyl hydrolase [Micromonospora sp. 4G53]